MRHVLRTLAVCALVALPFGLSGCGFAPLYAHQGVTSNLSQIAIEVPQTRTGYFLEQDLRNGFGGDDSSTKPYSLLVRMRERHYAIGFKVDDTSTRSEITTSVSYSLRDSRTGKVVFKDSFTETVTYDTSRSPFTGVISQQDAQERIASSISRRIQNELALYFHGDIKDPLKDTSAEDAEIAKGDQDDGPDVTKQP